MPGRGGCRRGAGRKAVWQDQETQTIRVPAALKEQLLDIGKALDQGQEFYAGQTCCELQRIIQEWETKCQRNDSPDWQFVRQLLDEIRSVLPKKPARVRQCRRVGHEQHSASLELGYSTDFDMQQLPPSLSP